MSSNIRRSEVESPSQQQRESPNVSNQQQLFVHDANLFRELLEGMSYPDEYEEYEDQESSPTLQRKTTTRMVPEKATAPLRPHTKPKEDRVKMEMLKEAKKQETEAFFQKIKENTERIRVRKQEKSEKKFQDLWNDILEERQTFLRDINEKLAAYEEGDERKRQQIYEEWCEKVFDPIQNQIDNHLASIPFEETQRKRRMKFEEYLNRLNHKQKNNGGVFRDIVLEDEYDPFELHKETFKYKPKKPSDQASAKQSHQLRKQDMLNVAQYDKLDATPFGHYSKMVHPNSNSSKLATL